MYRQCRRFLYRFKMGMQPYGVFTARKRSLGQGNIFTPVCHSVHRGGDAWLLQRGHAWLLLGGHVWLLGGRAWLLPGGACVVAPRGACMVAPGGACVVAPGGMYGWSRGACMVAGGACMGYDDTQRYGQWAGGTHPTGMHSCLHITLKHQRCPSHKRWWWRYV